MEVFEGSMADLGNCSAVLTLRRDEKVHQTGERITILISVSLVNAIGKKIELHRKAQRNFYARVFGILETADWRTASE